MRLLAGITYSPLPATDADGDGIAGDLDRCPQLAEDMDGFEDEDGCPDADNDKDGVLDTADTCPTEAEDIDGWEDEDGCPELPTQVSLTFNAPDGTPVEAVEATIENRRWTETGNPVRLVLDPGSYTLTAKAEGFGDTTVQFAIPRYEAAAITFHLAAIDVASLKIKVADSEGAPIEGSFWSPIGGARIPVAFGVEMNADRGVYDILVGAPGFGTTRMNVSLAESQVTEVQVSLARPRIEVTDDRIKLNE